jgi:SAM-dependent methyltransferase
MAKTDFSDNSERFTGFADVHDRHRCVPPDDLAEVVAHFGGFSLPLSLVVDLGSGTGLSTRYWAGHACEVIGIDPTADMRRIAEQATRAGNVRYREGYSHHTGLPGRCAQVVSCSQSLHGMEPKDTFQEARRILVPGGVFAAADYDLPPVTGSWETDAAFTECHRKVRELEKRSSLHSGLNRVEKEGHLGRMAESGCFRFVREVVLHHRERGNAERLIGLILSFGNVRGLMKMGLSETDLGIDVLRDVAGRSLGTEPRAWFWSTRVRMGVV